MSDKRHLQKVKLHLKDCSHIYLKLGIGYQTKDSATVVITVARKHQRFHARFILILANQHKSYKMAVIRNCATEWQKLKLISSVLCHLS